MIDRRTLLATVAGLTATTGFSACGQRDDGAQKGAEEVSDSWLRCRIPEPTAIDPLYVCDRAGLQVVSALFSPLMRLEPSGSLSPAAALSYEISDDARTFTFRLPDGAMFSNGESVTATSFKLGWERLVRAIPTVDDEGDAEPAYARWCHLLRLVDGYEALRSGRASELVGLRCPDDLTYAVSLTEPCSHFAQIAAHPALTPVPTVAYRDPEGFASRPVGNGPFKLQKAWKPGSDLRLVANKECASGAPLVEGALLTPIADTVSAFKEFRAGDLDICDVPIEQLSDAEEMAVASEDGIEMDVDRRLAHGLEAGLLYLACNCSSGAFSHPGVRRAASMAIDREALCRKVLKHSAEMAVSPISPRIGDVSPWDACSYDAELAGQLIEAERLPMQDASPLDSGSSAAAPEEPLLEPESEPLDLTVNLIYRKGGTGARVSAQVVRDLEAVGLSVKSEGLSADDFVERCRTSEFDCALRTFEPAVATVDVAMDGLFGSSAEASGADAAQDPVLADILERARIAVDSSERSALMAEALAKAGEDGAVIPLAHPAYTKIVSERVASAAVGASGAVDLAVADLL